MAVVVPDRTRRGYAGAAPAWAADASLVYGPLARHLVACSPDPLAGRIVLDAGAGTGVAGEVLAELGAHVVESDVEPSMLAHDRTHRPPAAAADVGALPFRTGAFDAVVAAFVLNHVASPFVAITELARVTRHGGVVLASTFAASRAPAKGVVDRVAHHHGWRPPSWYEVVSARATALGTSESIVGAASQAPFGAMSITETTVDVGLDDPAAILRYRLGMPQYAVWFGRLDQLARQRFVADAVAELTAQHEPFHPVVLELVARVR